MKQLKTISEKRRALKEQEERIWNDIDIEAKKLDKTLQKGIKSTAIIAGTVLIGYGLTKILTGNKKRSKKSRSAKSPRNQDFGIRIASTLIKAAAPVVINKINEQIKPND